MKIRKQSISNIVGGLLLAFLVMALYKFFFLFDNKLSNVVNGAYGPSTKTLDGVSFLLMLVSIYESSRIKKKKYFGMIFAAEILILISSIMSANNTFFDKWMSYWVLLLLYLALTMWMKDESRIDFFLITMQICAVINNILLIIQASILNMGGSSFLHIYFLESGYWYTYRNGTIRIAENEVLYLLVFCISVAYIKSQNKSGKLVKLLAWMNIITTLVNFFYIDQTRTIIAVSIFVLLINLVASKELTKRQFLLRFCIVFGASLLIGYLWDDITSILHFSTNETSYIARIKGYKFFFNLGLEHPICGVGFSRLLDSNGVNYTDVGIIGTLGQFGFILFAVYIMILIKMARMSMRNKYGAYRVEKSVNLNITFIIVFLSLTTMSFFNSGLLQVLAVSLALLETISDTTCCQRDINVREAHEEKIANA